MSCKFSGPSSPALGTRLLTGEPTASDKESPVAEFPMREWSLRLHILDEEGNERPADVFTKVVYHLHPTFENPVQSPSPPSLPWPSHGGASVWP